MQALLQNSTDAMKESRALDILSTVWNAHSLYLHLHTWYISFIIWTYMYIHFQLEPLAYRRMDFEEFRAATISPYQLEASSMWDEIASTAFECFEQEGNRVITIEELAQVCSWTMRMTWIFHLVRGTNQLASFPHTGDESFFRGVFHRPWLD